MAAVTPINLTAYGFETPAGPKTAVNESGGPGHMELCFVACGFTGTYVQGTGFQITSAQIASTIAGVKRDGGTIVVWDVAAAAAGEEGTSGVFTIPGPVAFTTTAGPATGLLYGNDLATEHAATAMQTFQTPVVFAVCFSSVQANV